MRNLFIILITIAIFIAYAESHNNGKHDEGNQKSPPNFNITHILLNSILLCGTDIVCNKSILPALNIQDGLNTPKKCPDCYCDYRCFRYAVQHSYPCCPDYFFQYGYMQCKDLSVFSVGKEEQTAVIASCPSNVNESLSNNCTKTRSEIDHVNTPPVRGKVSNQVYQNKYCSICNNEFHFDIFNVSLACPNIEEFNFISSYDEFNF